MNRVEASLDDVEISLGGLDTSLDGSVIDNNQVWICFLRLLIITLLTLVFLYCSATPIPLSQFLDLLVLGRGKRAVILTFKV